MESLFTNIPIDQTIDIIIQQVYNHPSVPPPNNLPRELLRQLLEICTKQSPCLLGNLYRQIQGVAMGSPLGPTFANSYLGHLEDLIFSDPTKRPNIYARYIDDIFVQVNNNQQLIDLQNNFQQNSVLKFTH